VEKAIREVVPRRGGGGGGQYRTYLSSINTIYNNTGTIGESTGHPDLAQRGHAPTAAMSAACAMSCPGAFPA